MDPKEWQRLADEVANEVKTALDDIEREFWPEPSDPSFRTFWPRIRSLSERLRTAPAIDIEVKLSLLGRIRQITKRARHDQEGFFAEQRHRKQETLDRIEELRSAAVGSSDPEEVRRLRQELVAIRDELGRLDLSTRGYRQEVWQSWQSATQAAWDHLSDLWSANEQKLRSILDQARSRLDRGNVRETRDLVRQFSSAYRTLEVAHKAGRALRSEANNLWREADEVAESKHEAFMATAGEKVERWKQVQGRNARAIAQIRAEIADLERSSSETGIGAAFAKALIEDKSRELERLESTNDSLEDRIEHTEAALSTAG